MGAAAASRAARTGPGSSQVKARSPITVAGAGNWMIAHDRIGPRVIELVEGRYPDDVEVCDLGAGGLSLLDELHGQELLLVVDACVGFGEAGEVRVVEPDLEQPLARGMSVHQVGPLEALVVAAHLWPERLPRRVLLILIETEGLGADQELSACEKAVRLLDRHIEECRRSLNGGADGRQRRGPGERRVSW